MNVAIAERTLIDATALVELLKLKQEAHARWHRAHCEMKAASEALDDLSSRIAVARNELLGPLDPSLKEEY